MGALRYRRRALSSRARIGRLAAVAAGLLAIGVVIGVLYDTLRSPPSGSMALPEIEPATADFPTPPAGAVVFAREAGANVLALGVVPRRDALQLQASVLDGDEHGVSGLRVVFSAGGVRRVGTACGAGCYRATVSPSRSPDAVSLVVVGRATSTDWRVALPAVWPPRGRHCDHGACGSRLAVPPLARVRRATRRRLDQSADERLAGRRTRSGVIQHSRRWRRDRDRRSSLGPLDTGWTMGRVIAIRPDHGACSLLGRRLERARPRHRLGRWSPGLAGLVLRSPHAGMVRSDGGEANGAHARAAHVHGGALHARRLSVVRPRAGDRSTALSDRKSARFTVRSSRIVTTRKLCVPQSRDQTTVHGEE